MLLAEDARPELKEPEAAAKLGVTPAALRKMRERGQGPAFFRINRSVRYDPADIAAYIGNRRVAPRVESRS